MLERAIEDLAEAAERDPGIGSAAASLHDRLQELAARVVPRTQHGLIRGELGPDHVLVDASGHPVLIDVEVAMRLSLVAGPLRLLDGDFPHRTVMQEIAEHHAKEALALLVS